jgi:hypothetical protein
VAYSSIPETAKHIQNVKECIDQICCELLKRAESHDRSKTKNPELEFFNKYTPLLKSLTYGSKDYQESLEALQPALTHHYAKNRHHPEHHTLDAAGQGVDEISCMNLVDIIEMFCDWMAASKRTKDGNPTKSINVSCKRFYVNEQLRQIFHNTLRDLINPK